MFFSFLIFMHLRRPIKYYKNDPPLTEYGGLTAEFMGHGIKMAGYKPEVVSLLFSSLRQRDYDNSSQALWRGRFHFFRFSPRRN